MSTPAVRTEGLSRRYGSVDALTGLDLEIAPGEVVGYVPGEASLWPSLTGTETLHLLGLVHGQEQAFRTCGQEARAICAAPDRPIKNSNHQ